MKKIKILSLILLFSLPKWAGSMPPDEGMWLPLLIKDYNYEEMKRLGCKLTPEQIYSVNNSSIKDAIVQLGGFCTAEVISDQGLILTNHHCGYDAIATLSSEENNYLRDGFWAANNRTELPAEGLTVSFLERMEDVTDRILTKADAASASERSVVIEEEKRKIQEENSSNGAYSVSVKEMFDGNAYYLFIYKVYRDIRLVGTPPSSVGKFGGDTDNWMWPRHTGDFSMFRIYADANNEPADYSESNVPFKPKHSLPISLQGLNPGDFTMIMGYPGSTDRYLTSFELKNLQENEAPIYVEVLKKRLEIMKAEMDKSEQVKIDNASNYASLANTYKYFKGQLRGLKKFNLLKTKEGFESNLQKWIDADSDLKSKYGNLLADMEKVYSDDPTLSKDMAYINVAAFAPQFIGTGFQLWRLQSMLDNGSQEDIDALCESIAAEAEHSFEEYNTTIDQNILTSMLDMLKSGLSEERQLSLFSSDYYTKKAKGSSAKFSEMVFAKSVLTDQGRLTKFLKKPSLKKLQKDPGMIYMNSVIDMLFQKLQYKQSLRDKRAEELRKLYMQIIQKKEPTKSFYPDANFTMRLTYGSVKSYDSWEGKPFENFTYGHQILDKYKAGDEEFDVPEKLRTLLKNKDYGQYADKDGKLTVCFLHNTDITGGNSGSPVINGNGELVGCAFDGNWESMTSDLFWQDEYVRTISVDIRYVLFIVDKFAGASHLLDEMNLVK